MSVKEPAGTRKYHATNMPRRDPISQGILNRVHGKEVEDKFSSKLPEMSPETAHHFKNTSDKTTQLINELIPRLSNRMDEVEASNKRIEDLQVKRDREINDKFDSLLAAIASMNKAPKKTRRPAEQPAEDFQGEADDDLPPPEK